MSRVIELSDEEYDILQAAAAIMNARVSPKAQDGDGVVL